MNAPSQAFSFAIPRSSQYQYQYAQQPIAGPSSAAYYPQNSMQPYQQQASWMNSPSSYWGTASASQSWSFGKPELSPLAIADHLPETFPSSPTDTCSSNSTLCTPASGAVSLLPVAVMGQDAVIVCDVPLLAPKPLPYHPPRFLQFDDMPPPDADLSQPPFSKKRARSNEDYHMDAPAQKRVALAGKTSYMPLGNSILGHFGFGYGGQSQAMVAHVASSRPLARLPQSRYRASLLH